MTSPTNSQIAMRFDGQTFDFDRDGKRLGAQMKAVMDFLLSHRGEKYSLREIAYQCRAPEASVSARLRDMRKARFGGHNVQREYIGNGLHVYWVEA